MASAEPPAAAPPPPPENGTELVSVAVEQPKAEKKQGAEYTADEQLLTFAELSERFGIAIDAAGKSPGLSEAEAAARLVKYGPNKLTPPKTTPLWLQFLKKFTDKLMILLMIAGALSFIAYGIDTTQAANWEVGVVLFGVVVLTCYVSYLQDKAASDVLASIKGLLSSSCAVIRDGGEKRVDPALLVPGDVVRLGLGDRVPADLRIIANSELKTESSSLTGESDAIAATVVAVHEHPIECRNLVFASSLVMNGEGYGVVIRTADNTMIGSIASLAAGSGVIEETLLEKEVHRFVLVIAAIAVFTAVVLFSIGEGRGRPFIFSFVNGFIIVIVANVPEGLPATVASCLSITAKRMAERHVLIKRTNIIESLGSATVIASDKTGTLTQNRMTVENLWYNRSVFSADTGGRPAVLEQMVGASASYLGSPHGAAAPSAAAASSRVGSVREEGDGERTLDGGASQLSRPMRGVDSNITSNSFTLSAFGGASAASSASWERFSPHAKLMIIAGVCNRARYEDADGGGAAERTILGDASDAGLLRYCDKTYPVAIARRVFPKVHEIPFNSVNKWSIAVSPDPGAPTKRQIVFMKGAPEIVLARCTTYMHRGGERPIDEDFKEDWTNAYERFGSCGERVLGFAFRVVPASKPEAYASDEALCPKDGLVFCGLISLVDPPRPGVAEAIASCRAAGIRVTMVTGDHPLTAEAIARKVNIITRSTRRDVALEDGVAEADIALADERVESVVVTGSQIGALSQDDWDAILSKKEVVFARTSPQQKLKLVENYQRRGEVVAVTGDGVNDSPALKRAQIGVAMGSINASDVAREAADIILLDDNFASIVAAIEEGRTLFDNLRKTVAYTLAHLWPELLPVFLNLAFSFPLALNALMILTIDLLTEQGPAISLAYERAEAAVMTRKPRNLLTDRLVTPSSLFYSYFVAGITNALVCMGCFFLVYVRAGIPLSRLAFSVDAGYFAYPPFEVAADAVTGAPVGGGFTSGGTDVPLLVTGDGRTYDAHAQWQLFCESQAAWYITLVMCQFWHIWNCRTRSTSILHHGIFTNVVTLYGTAVEVAIAVAVVYVPPFQINPNAFQTSNLEGIFWTPHLIYGGYIFAFNEGMKWCVRNRPDSFVARYLSW